MLAGRHLLGFGPVGEGKVSTYGNPYLGIQFPREIYDDLRKMAHRKQVSLKKLGRDWICERLVQEQKKEAECGE